MKNINSNPSTSVAVSSASTCGFYNAPSFLLLMLVHVTVMVWMPAAAPLLSLGAEWT